MKINKSIITIIILLFSIFACQAQTVIGKLDTKATVTVEGLSDNYPTVQAFSTFIFANGAFYLGYYLADSKPFTVQNICRTVFVVDGDAVQGSYKNTLSSKVINTAKYTEGLYTYEVFIRLTDTEIKWVAQNHLLETLIAVDGDGVALTYTTAQQKAMLTQLLKLTDKIKASR